MTDVSTAIDISDDSSNPIGGATTHLGTTIGGFMILRKLGEGGMGVVYAAYDARLDRNIAIKLLRARPGQTASMARFAREAKGLAQISHPNVVQIHHVGPHEDGMFIAMEYIAGLTLGRWLERESKWQPIVDVLIQAGRGLAAAHAANLIHRDFKPSNVMVADEGRVRVLDFGLVRSVDESEDESLTQTGSQPGTPAYMAPEQIAGRGVEPRTDQFAFCMVAFEALYGELPFGSGSLTSRANRMMKGRIARPAKSKVPRRIHRAVIRGLAAEPERRWPSMQALLVEFEGSVAFNRGRVWGLVVVLVGFVILLGVQIATTPPGLGRHEQELREDILQRESENLELESANLELTQRLRLQTALTTTWMADSPGHRDEAMREAIDLMGAPQPAGEPPLPAVEFALSQATRGLHHAWEQPTHARRIVDMAVDAAGERFFIVDAEGHITISGARNGEPLAPFDTSASVELARFAPNVERLAIATTKDTIEVWTIGRTIELGQTLELGDRVTALAFLGDGSTLIATEAAGAARIWELGSGRVLASIPDLQVDSRTLTVCADGSRLAAAGPDGTIRLFDGRDGVPLGTLATNHSRIIQLSCAERGSRLISVGEVGSPTLWDTAKLERLAPLEGPRVTVKDATFSPDGEFVVTVGTDSIVRIYVGDSGRRIDMLEGQPGIHTHARFSPSGQQLAIASMDGWARVWTVEPVAETTLVRAGDRPINAMAIASDRSRVIMGGQGRAILLDVESGQPLELDHGNAAVQAVAFSSDDSEVATGDDLGRVQVWNASSGQRILELPGHDRGVLSLAFSPKTDLLASGDSRGHVRLWAIRTGALVDEWDIDEVAGSVTSLVFSPEGSLLAATDSYRVAVRKLTTGKFVYEHDVAPEARVSVLAFSPDAAWIAFAGTGLGVQVRALADDRQILAASSTDSITTLAFTPDGRRIASGGDLHVYLWDIGTGQCVAALGRHTAPVLTLGFSVLGFSGEDDVVLFSGSADGELQRSEATASRRLELACEALRRLRSYGPVARICRADL